MREQTVFILADQALNNVIQQIKDDQWGIDVPAAMMGGRTMTLRELINYHAYDELWVPDVLAGKTIAEVGRSYGPDLLGENPRASYAVINEAGQAAMKQFTDLDKVVHLSYGDFPARDYLVHTTLYRGLQSYDIASIIDVDTTMPDDLVQGLWDEISPQANALRQMGVFGPEVEVPTDASLQDRLLGLTGRSLR